jgi:hypothetical protein
LSVKKYLDVEKNIESDIVEVFLELFHLMYHLFKSDKEQVRYSVKGFSSITRYKNSFIAFLIFFNIF